MSQSASSRSFRIFGVVIIFLFSSSFGQAAQTNTATPPQSPSQNPQATAKDDEKEKKETPKKNFDPEMKELTGREFMTSDRVVLTGSFFPGNADKETVPVILLHGQGKSRDDFTPLIAEMKKRGYAILTFDFRGHGESTTRFPDPREIMAGQASGTLGPGMEMGGAMPGMMPQTQMPMQPPKPVEYLVKDFKKADYENMFKFDCLPFYRFLLNENNEGRLNLNKLVIVGVDMGGTVGGRMTKQLWANSKGKNVRSLIILSPNYDSFSKMVFKDSKCFHKDVSFLMIVGQLDKRAKDNAVELRKDILGKEKSKEENLRIAEFPTERQGGELLKESKLGIPQKIADDIDETLAGHKNFNWRKM